MNKLLNRLYKQREEEPEVNLVGSYRRLMARHYWMQMKDGRLTRMPDHAGIIHDCGTDRPAPVETMERMLEEAGVVDGDEFEILITKTGVRPHGDRRFIMDKGGVLRPETDDEVVARIEAMGELVGQTDDGAVLAAGKKEEEDGNQE